LPCAAGRGVGAPSSLTAAPCPAARRV
jgi:hypothetical protein